MDKQRVLIVNKFYYPRGGDCVVTLNLERLLNNNGHATAIYAMKYPENIGSQWQDYFASEVDFGGPLKEKLRAARRTLGMGDIKQSFNRILADFKPDVVHLNNIHSYLSPIIAEHAHRYGARVVWTLHDYKLICPSYSCLNQGLPCEKCFSSRHHVLTDRCMKGSLAASVIAWLEALKWNRRRLEKAVDCFICPSAFIKSKMVQAGFSPSKLVTLCNFVDPVKLSELASLPADERVPGNYCYIGRLSPEKGVTELLEVAASLPDYHLYVAGDGPLYPMLREKHYRTVNIHFLGRIDAKAVSDLLAHSASSVIPSRCYENNPLGVIESLCAGTPVIGAAIGGIPELISNDNGATYSWDNADEMRKAIVNVMSRRWDNRAIAQKSIELFSPENHYRHLMEIYCGKPEV